MTFVKKTGVFTIGLMILIGLYFGVPQITEAATETSRTNYTLATGVTESTIYVTDMYKNNTRVHLLRIDKNANVSFKVSTKNYYKQKTKAKRKKAAKKWKLKNWGYSRVATQVNNYNKTKDKVGTVIAATNGDFFSYNRKYNGRPTGNLIVEGNKLHSSKKEPFFAVMKNGEKKIFKKGSSTKNVVEAISGNMMLVKNGKVSAWDKNYHSRAALGVTEDGDVVYIAVDGREPASKGLPLHEVGDILKKQECINAINLDGGGSVSLLTKRKGNKKVAFRNVPADGYIRNVSSSLLIVKNKKSSSKTVTGDQVISMKKSDTGLVKDSSGAYQYFIDGKKQTGFFMVNNHAYLFDNNGNGATKTIKIGKYKYTFKLGRLTKCSQKGAGLVKIGYCGAVNGGKNLIYAYNSSKKNLNIGLNPMVKKNGKMKNWVKYDSRLPWYTERDKIKGVNIGSGVTNIGSYFLHILNVKNFEGSPGMKSRVKKVSLPSSLKTIGNSAFEGQYRIKNLIVSAKVTKVGKAAFKGSCKGYVRFKSSKPPKFGKSALAKIKAKRIYVKKTSKWKKFVKAKKFKKLGFKKSVKYK